MGLIPGVCSWGLFVGLLVGLFVGLVRGTIRGAQSSGVFVVQEIFGGEGLVSGDSRGFW